MVDSEKEFKIEEILILILEDIHRLHKAVLISPNNCHRLRIVYSI